MLLKTTVPDPGVNVPSLLVQSPPVLLMVVAVPALNVPLVKVSNPPMFNVVVLPPTVSDLEVLATVIALNVWALAVPLIFWSAVVLLNTTVPEPGVNVPSLLVQSPVTLVFVPAV